MSNKILKHIKKVIITCMIVVLCSPGAVSAFSYGSSFGTGGSRYGTNSRYGITSSSGGFFKNLIEGFLNIGQDKDNTTYGLEEALQALKKMQTTNPTNLKLEDIMAIIDKLPLSLEKLDLQEIINTFNIFGNSGNSGIDLGSLVTTLIGELSSIVDGLVGSIGGTSLKVEPEEININAQSAVKFAGDKYSAKLAAKVYKNQQSNKWALLIHPFMMSGKSMANAVGPYYYNKGYNILAIDLRGFGNSEGSVALGVLESLDAYDWLVEMNKPENKNIFGEIDHIIVHGTSLGGATTNFLSGIDKFMPKEMSLTPISKLKVVALVQDCGYANMKQFADESFIKSLNVGLEDKDFAYYSNALNSLQYCELPLLTIHGDADTMVKYNENAPQICNTVNSNNYGGSAKLVTISGGAHAVIIMGSNSTYETAVNSFIQEIEKNKDFDFERVTYEIPETGTGLLDQLLNALKGIFKF